MSKRTDKEFYKYLDALERKHLKRINLLLEQSKNRYKDLIYEKITNSNLKNGNFILNDDDFNKLKQKLKKSFDEYNILFFEDVGEHYYKQAEKDIEEFTTSEVESKYYKKKVNDLLNSFIMAKGINYIYSQEIERRIDYYNSQMINSYMATLNAKLSTLESIKNYKGILLSELENNDIEVNNTLKTQKKQLGTFVDNVGVFVASEITMQAFKDHGIEKVLYVAEIDEKTCEDCYEIDGLTFNINEAPTIPMHSSCRCHYEVI